MLQLYNWLEFAFAEKDILQEECSKDKQMLPINIEIQKKLASDDLEVAKQQIQELESCCWGICESVTFFSFYFLVFMGKICKIVLFMENFRGIEMEKKKNRKEKESSKIK